MTDWINNGLTSTFGNNYSKILMKKQIVKGTIL